MARPGPFGAREFRDLDPTILALIDGSTFDQLSRTCRKTRKHLVGDPTQFYYHTKTTDINYTLILSRMSLLGRWLEWSRPRDLQRTWATWAWRTQCRWLCHWARVLAAVLRTIWLVGAGMWISLVPLLCWPLWHAYNWDTSVFFLCLWACSRLVLVVRDAVEHSLASRSEHDQSAATVWDTKQRVMSFRRNFAHGWAAWFGGDPADLPARYQEHHEEMRVVSAMHAFILDQVAICCVYVRAMDVVIPFFLALDNEYISGVFIASALLLGMYGLWFAWHRVLVHWQRFLIPLEQRSAMAASQNVYYADAILWLRLQIHPEIAILRPFIPWALPSPIRKFHISAAVVFMMGVVFVVSTTKLLYNMDVLFYAHVAITTTSMFGASILLHALRFHIAPVWKWSWASTTKRYVSP